MSELEKDGKKFVLLHIEYRNKHSASKLRTSLGSADIVSGLTTSNNCLSLYETS